MIIQVLFIVTALVSILVAIRLIGAIVGANVKVPVAERMIVAYPSIMFQVWYWSQPLFN